MRSSYRIIKNSRVDFQERQSAPIDTRVDISTKFYKSDIELLEDMIDNIDEEALKSDIREQMTLEIEEERKRILEQAKEEGISLIEQIRDAAYKKGYEEGNKTGYEDGYGQGLNQGKKEAEIIKDKALNMIYQSEEYVEVYYKENKENLLELSTVMAESIVHKTIDISDENIMMILNPLLKEYAHKDNIIITCHPENAEIIKERLEELEDHSGENKIIILKDGNLDRNGCTLENSHQVIDLQVKTQIENILEEIKLME